MRSGECGMKEQIPNSELRTPNSKFRIPSSAAVVWSCVVVLGILHQDVWWWDDKTLVLGFMPIGLAYHALYSIVAGLLWAAAVKWAWPTHIEQWADELEPAEASHPECGVGSSECGVGSAE